MFLFLTIKNPHFHPHFSLESTFAEGLQCKYKFYKQVLCHPANSKSSFLSLLIFKRPLVLLIFQPIQFDQFIYFVSVLHCKCFSLANKYLLAFLLARLLAAFLAFLLAYFLLSFLFSLLTHSLTHSLTHPPTHPPTHSLTHALEEFTNWKSLQIGSL